MYPTVELQQKTESNPIKYWQIENEWLWQPKDCSVDPPKSVTLEQRINHLKEMSTVIKEKDSEAKIILGAFTGVSSIAIYEYKDFYSKIETGGDDCDYELVDLSGVSEDKIPEAARERQALIEDILREGAPYYDIIDLHFYETRPINIAYGAAWVRGVLEKQGISGKKIWSLENAGPFFFFPLMNLPKPAKCEKDYSNIKEYTIYSDKILSEYVVKHYVIGLNSGIEKTAWSSYVPTLGWNENFLRTSLLDLQYEDKPALYTYKLLNEKISNAKTIEKVENQIFKFTFDNQESLFVLWSEEGDKIVNMSKYLSTENAKVTHIITEPGKMDSDAVVETISANSIRLTETPIFVE